MQGPDIRNRQNDHDDIGYDVGNSIPNKERQRVDAAMVFGGLEGVIGVESLPKRAGRYALKKRCDELSKVDKLVTFELAFSGDDIHSPG